MYIFLQVFYLLSLHSLLWCLWQAASMVALLNQTLNSEVQEKVSDVVIW